MLQIGWSSDYQAQEHSKTRYIKKKPWIACTIFCKYIDNDGNIFDSDVEMSRFGFNSFLPDGT